ncbi:hypothetical protein B0H19DRAFT_1209333 [Mycena capillaripes]|nr:hypothetical protein B0H19DRAFT_1209333 [Mycena capillaripes]
MPVAAFHPTVVISLRALEVFRVASLRCPRLGVQAFIRTLCDIHGVAPRPWLASQFSVTLDVYFAIREVVDRRVQVALGRDTPDWRLKNACPPCMYKLEGEPPLPLPLLITADGNNSLWRLETREKEKVFEDGTTAPGASKERLDDRPTPGDYYLPRAEVDRWAKEGLEDLMKGFVPNGVEQGEDEEDSCTERWQNMKQEVTARAWGMYDETGIFPALCRHGFVLIVVDMVKSGELSKYGFAVTAHLLQVLGEHLLGYDIGCKFAKMCKSHPVLSKLAANNNFKAIIGSFHGHGHNRRCQTKNLATYVKGVGLESLEGCEAYFSKSNALAATTRHASRFHRQQAIVNYMKHTDDFDTYHNLTSLLASKYRRALEIRATHSALCDTMRRLGVESQDVFDAWLEKEKAYLLTLSKEPLEESMEMEYYQKLVMPAQADASYADAAASTRKIETQRRHALELQAKALAVVQDLEMQMEIEARWVEGDEKWTAAAEMVYRQHYQRVLDHLEGLVMARMFELAKCHMAGTGYALRQHIAKALQARSKAIKAAIIRYNEAAEEMDPPMPMLDWEEVVEFAFLADFDLLREARQDIRQEPWASPAGRAAMDQHFKLLCADEEIARLNIEIRRLVTYMVDEDNFLSSEEHRLRQEGNDAIAHQVGVRRWARGRFTSIHMSRLTKLSKIPGFSGDIVPGVSLSRERHTPVVRDVEMRAPSPLTRAVEPPPQNDDDEDEEGHDDDEDLFSLAFMNIVRISSDAPASAEDT